MTIKSVSPGDVKAWLSDGVEIAFFDVRELGQFGQGHPFFAVPLAYSCFEARLGALAPNRSVRMVLMDGGDGIAERAAARAASMGYGNVSVMAGGAPAWGAAGYTLYEGVNLPSKTFGEILEIERHTPRKSPLEVAAMSRDGANHVIVDGRPYAEYSKFNIPGGICCPNGELALRIGEIVPDPETTIIVNCAGRTRSILGAQTLIDFGVPNPVYALENGTQGWLLDDMTLEYGADRSYPAGPDDSGVRDTLRAKAKSRAEKTGVPFIARDEAQRWLSDAGRTTYVFDVRTHEEHAADGIAGIAHAPGGQLVQATDQWVGVHGARLIIVDDDQIRAPMVANWLHQLGHEAAVLDGGLEVARSLSVPPAEAATLVALQAISPGEVAGSGMQLVDLRPSMTYRAGHIDGARWSTRSRLDALALEQGQGVALIADDAATAALAAQRLGELGPTDVRQLSGGPDDWRAAGLAIVATDNEPADADCIDYLFFTHERNAGNKADARRYLEWEVGLVDQLDKQERDSFQVAPA